MDLKNIHSAFAIYAGLQSQAIHRLKMTWAVSYSALILFQSSLTNWPILIQAIPSRDRSTVDRMAKLFSEDKNWERLRKLINSLKLPCIPYLGRLLASLLRAIFLTLRRPLPNGPGVHRRRSSALGRSRSWPTRIENEQHSARAR